MNKQRRIQIGKIIDEIEKVVFSAKVRLEELQGEIEEARDEEQDYLDNIPENLQCSERYEAAEAAVDNLDSACDAIGDLLDAIDCEDLVSYLTDAAE